MRKMKMERMNMQESMQPHKREEKRVIGEYREVNFDLMSRSKRTSF